MKRGEPHQTQNPKFAIRNAMTSRNQIVLALFALILLVFAARAYFANRSQPQLSSSREVFQTVDALFTAVTAHDSQRVADCRQRLAQYKDRGSLPAAAARRLDRIISLAQSGDWTTAARGLYDFMQGQQRKAASADAGPKLTAMHSRKAG
jgi:hypothetical protein